MTKRNKILFILAFFSTQLIFSASSNYYSANTSVNEVKISQMPKIGSADLKEIGEKIFRNEAAGKKENLVYWNSGENFPSLGIGHFIWYRKNQTEIFDESFPKLVDFYKVKYWHYHIPSHKSGRAIWRKSLYLDFPEYTVPYLAGESTRFQVREYIRFYIVCFFRLLFYQTHTYHLSHGFSHLKESKNRHLKILLY